MDLAVNHLSIYARVRNLVVDNIKFSDGEVNFCLFDFTIVSTCQSALRDGGSASVKHLKSMITKARNYLCFFALASGLSCNTAMCGDLSGQWKTMFDNAKRKYDQYADIEYIPCEFYYVKVKLKGEFGDNSVIKRLHSDLYDPQNKIGWRSLECFDDKGRYIFKHFY